MAEKKTGAKGFTLEESLRAAFRRSGYFVLGGLPFRLDGEDVTDVDLWLYERPVATNRRRVIVDIRNRKSPKAAERLIWTKGLLAALRVDGAMVATTDARPATRRLAKSLGLTLLDRDAMKEMTSGTSDSDAPLSWAEFHALMKQVDDTRRTTEWRDVLGEAQGAILSGFGVQSANSALLAFEFFAQQVVQAQPGSKPAEVATRVAYLVAALGSVSFDFVGADLLMRPKDDRRAVIMNTIRFGQAEVAPSLASVRAAIGLARKYAENGKAVASQIELGFRNDADQIPAEIIADFVLRSGPLDRLFETARELEEAATARSIPAFDALSIEARSALGSFLDYASVSREKFATAISRKAAETVGSAPQPTSPPSAGTSAEAAGPLFGSGGKATS